MLAMLNFLNVHNLPIFQPILMILVSKFMVHRALIDKTYLSLGLLSPLINDVKLFPAVYRRIYCHKYLTLSNQTSRYKSKCIRIYLFYLFLRFLVPFFTVVIPLRKIGSRHLFRC